MLVIHGLVLFMVMNDNVVKTMPTTTTYLGTVFTSHLNGEIGGMVYYCFDHMVEVS